MFWKKNNNDDKKSDQSMYEYCEIFATESKFEVNQYQFRFFAKASRPNGESYTVEVSKNKCPGRQPFSEDKQTQNVLNELKVLLISQAWELLPQKGKHWYSIKFRRLIKFRK